ncbi:MAG: transposase family protein [Psychroserpens sp.]|nr:transposase family protein [Psychroserpens sp.]
MDYYSKNIDIEKLPSQTAGVVIEKLKKCFAQNGVPEIVVSDNGPCFHSHEFKEFSKEWNFAHKTSSLRYPQANGQAEAGVKIAKQILAQDEPHLALMTYRATPVQSTGVSPSELAFGRILKTNLPILPYNYYRKLKMQIKYLTNVSKAKNIKENVLINITVPGISLNSSLVIP